ncbi:FtsW/RodA/SpoVE family cell cycle protein [Limnovirga soli]|uniref:Probable peptidoglycan glycosyltransferase FtsW n=1 Tax=Limnovirga soli TaxID=2656915 RepID=A0A8J8FFC5_9BACT|nr:FtsW/RodA/SpoVE family cell cycle protein [Limnovirga soli]NNV57030.1 cell division protein FtsW [Limnovirga soli]
MNETADKLFAQIPSVEVAGGHILKGTRGDRYIWGIVVLLALISLLVVYSATGSLAYKMYQGNNEVYLFRQLSFIVLGFVVIYFLHRINYTLYSRISLILYLISVPLLIYTLFFGAEINDGSRWIKLPVINMTIQTSDFARLALFMYLSRQLSRKQEVIKDFKKAFIPLIVPVFITCGLIMPANLSNALLTGATSILLLFIGRVSVKHILLVIAIALIPILLIIGVAVSTHNANTENKAANNSLAQSMQSVGRFGTWVSRVQSFMYAEEQEIPYQVQQSNIAIANGGILFGLGPGNSRQRNFLPQAYNDFIYAIIIEEYGLLGGAFVMFIYLIFLFRCIRVFRRCPYAFGAFLALGLSFTLVIQAVANMAVNVNIVPVTGVTLPLISMGGSSFLFTCASIGIVLSVARNLEQMEGRQMAAAAKANEQVV